MGKLLSWVVLIALAWAVLHLIAISQRRRERGRGAADAAARAPGGAAHSASERTIEGEPIVPCAHCGVFVPASDAVRDGGRAYCGVAHRDASRASRVAPDDADEVPGRHSRSRDA